MNVCIAASGEQRAELACKTTSAKIQIQWVTHTAELLQAPSEFLIDCTFTGSILPAVNKPLLIHSPVHTLSDLNANGAIARFCAWNSFLKRDIWEIAIMPDTLEETWLQSMMGLLEWKFKIVKDIPGLIAPRIVCNVINEAYYALQEGISSKEEIDLAMKLGTNYPYGPFEWADKIGINNVQELLRKLTVRS